MKKELHLATSVQALNDLAQKNIKIIKPEKLYYSAEKLFKSGQSTLHEGDEETAYILFVRFILIYKYLENESNDKRYTKNRLGREYATISELLNELKASLQARYDEQKKEEIVSPKADVSKPEAKNADAAISFPSGYITCSELYSLINKEADIVILDVRREEDFSLSRIKHSCCVNIPEEIINSGSSANILSKQVPNESLSHWNRRWKSSITVLLDWSSTKETITGSKLNIFKDILINWDITMEECKPPIILNGGYLEWLQMYPMLCLNPDVVYKVQNSVLNDLLNLDSIEYPSTEETIPAKYLKPASTQPIINRATKPVLGDATSKQNENASDLNELRTKRNLEAEEGMRFELQQREEKLLEDKAALEKSKQELNEENEQLRKKLQSIIDSGAKPTESPNKVEDIRARLLQEAREKKKDIVSNTTLNSVIRSKVIEFEKTMRTRGRLSTKPGLTGLHNLGATCYMNSIIQCYSNTRIIHNLFVLRVYNNGKNLEDKPYGKLTTEFMKVICQLWSGNFKCISPSKFKEVVDECGPRFKGKEQQDAHEFMVALNTWLHEELKKDIARDIQVIWTPRQRNWINSTEGKTSIILETFCGQQVNIISCTRCKKRKERLELFENLAIALPDQEFCTLEDCINEHFSKQKIEDYNCSTCKDNKFINMEMKLVGHPPVLVLCLKRFTEAMIDNVYTFVRKIVSVKYPLANLNVFGASYNLYAVVVHKTAGVTLDSGHYFAIIKNLWSGKWYKYDDQYVTEVHKNYALQPTDAYILFYRTVNEEKDAKIDYYGFLDQY